MAGGRISVVMVTWRTGPQLSEAVDAVLAAPDIDEFVLVNHENPPEVLAALRKRAEENPKMTLIDTGANLGFSKGCNIGANAATGDYLFFLNPDAVLPGGLARRLVDTGETAHRPWLVGARLLDKNGKEQRGARRGLLTPWTAMVGFLGLHRLEPVFGRAFHDIHRERDPVPPGPIRIDVTSGAAMMMRRDDYETLGGFDERYFLHVEDIDLCRRVLQAGGHVLFEPRAELLHYGSTSEASLFRVEWNKAHGFRRYFWKFYDRFPQRLLTLMAIPVIYGLVVARSVYIWVRGWIDGWYRRIRKLDA